LHADGGRVKTALKIVGCLALAASTAALAAWFLYKPVRLFFPGWTGAASCLAPRICVEDSARYPEALRLYGEARSFVAKTVGPPRKPPRVVFCSTEECFHAFGFHSTAGTLGRWGIVIGPRGWKDYYVRHEMIHHRQAEELGFIAQNRDPDWLIEGMAYALSGDPRRPLLGRWEECRARFEAWYQGVGRERLWAEARKF
jgi:hypothetical protein